MVNYYLVAAYSLAWLIFGAYAWSISRRQSQLRKDLEDLERQLGARNISTGAE